VEVTEDDVGGFVNECKRKGYTTVALEQSATSVCISQYAFPEKVVILLGKEKEGVPVELLNTVDQCVEIPQMGIIRSLNVHVSASIMVWEANGQRIVGDAAVITE
jgi:tRNA G18 (ribose-2'-O)-methylase SpoU